jgi:hypothetical protein
MSKAAVGNTTYNLKLFHMGFEAVEFSMFKIFKILKLSNL